MEIKRGQTFALFSITPDLQKHNMSQKISLQRFLYRMRQRNNCLFINTSDRLIPNWFNVFFFCFKTDIFLCNVSFSGHFLIFFYSNCTSCQETQKKDQKKNDKKSFQIVKLIQPERLSSKLEIYFAAVYR